MAYALSKHCAVRKLHCLLSDGGLIVIIGRSFFGAPAPPAFPDTDQVTIHGLEAVGSQLVYPVAGVDIPPGLHFDEYSHN
ncbi:MAG: hypothetical protein K0U66_08430 [Gammaproteobacteria bacterium]|nr:hypothetical protein [Gammaproteobacteria bacterium]